MADAGFIRRKKPTDVPFSPDLSEVQLTELASHRAFNDLEAKFRSSKAFRHILKNHARVVRCQDGDIVVREGDWGNSAFLIMSGSVMVELEPTGQYLPDESLGRRRTRRKGLFQALAQLWTRHADPEYRDRQSYVTEDETTRRRGIGEETRVYLQDVPGVLSRFRHTQLDAGAFFGELAALGRTARTATVFAKGDTELLELRWQGLRDLMRGDQGIRRRIDQGFRDNALKAFLQNSPIFRHLVSDEEAMEELVREARFETFGEYDHVGSFKQLVDEGVAFGLESEPIVAQEGEHPNGVIIVRSGVARVSRRFHHGHRTISYLTPGQAFGFEEIQDAWRESRSVPLASSLRAIGYLTVVIIGTPMVEKHLLQRWFPQGTSAGLPGRRTRVPDQARLPDLRGIDQDFAEFLVQRRFVNGTATMLIDLDRCTRCDDCVRACARTHDNNPRFLRHGPTHGGIMVASACMHCQDPVCMIECPTGAISRRLDEGEVTINDGTCVGCGSCSRNCPYDAIRMVEIRDDQGKFIRDKTFSARSPITKATKCDLCVEQWGGPACQRACPHDALVRMDMSNVAKLAAWHDR